MNISVHVGFDGNCREAMAFYEKALGAKLEMQMTWRESPMCDQTAEADKDKIMHASLRVGDSMLMGADSPAGRYQKPQGVVVSFNTDDVAEAKKVFDALAEGGSVQMPFQETFWARGFGMATDRYNVPWMVNCGKSM